MDGTRWGACDCGGSNGSGGAAGSGGVRPLATGGSGPPFSTGGANGTGGSSAGATGDGGPTQLDLYIMLDQSTSMSCTAATGSRWDAVTGALKTFARTANSNVGVGLGYFGAGSIPILSSCNLVDYKPDVEIGPLSDTSALIVSSLGAHAPSTNTPTAVALQSAVAHATDWKALHTGHDVVVVLVTDGQPNACGGLPDVVSAAAAGLANSGVRTYVVGVIDPSSTCSLDPNPPAAADLDSVASAGGTQKALIADMSAAGSDPTTQLSSAMNAIVGRETQ